MSDMGRIYFKFLCPCSLIALLNRSAISLRVQAQENVAVP